MDFQWNSSGNLAEKGLVALNTGTPTIFGHIWKNDKSLFPSPVDNSSTQSSGYPVEDSTLLWWIPAEFREILVDSTGKFEILCLLCHDSSRFAIKKLSSPPEVTGLVHRQKGGV